MQNNQGGGKKKTPARKEITRADRKAGARVEYERARQIIFKTQTICGICGKPVEKDKYKPPHPLSATCDHIIPVSRGGHPFSLDNLQLAHRICNLEKKNKILASDVKDDRQKKISNRILPQHTDWTE